MARKSTKKSKETKETTTKKKTTSKKPKDVKITFKPLFSAANNYTAYLQKRAQIVDNGNEIIVDKPMIEGLPGVFTIKAGEIKTITQEQCDKLIELGFVETEEEREYRKSIEQGLAPQHPLRLDYDVMATNKDFNIKPRELEKIYTDKLMIVD